MAGSQASRLHFLMVRSQVGLESLGSDRKFLAWPCMVPYHVCTDTVGIEHTEVDRPHRTMLSFILTVALLKGTSRNLNTERDQLGVK